MAPIKATCYAGKSKGKLGSILYILSYFTVFIWPVFNWICQLFEWDQELDSIDTKFGRSPLIIDDDTVFPDELQIQNAVISASEHSLVEQLEEMLEKFSTCCS